MERDCVLYESGHTSFPEQVKMCNAPLFHTMTPPSQSPAAGPGASSLPQRSCCVTSAGAERRKRSGAAVKLHKDTHTGNRKCVLGIKDTLKKHGPSTVWGQVDCNSSTCLEQLNVIIWATVTNWLQQKLSASSDFLLMSCRSRLKSFKELKFSIFCNTLCLTIERWICRKVSWVLSDGCVLLSCIVQQKGHRGALHDCIWD